MAVDRFLCSHPLTTPLSYLNYVLWPTVRPLFAIILAFLDLFNLKHDCPCHKTNTATSWIGTKWGVHNATALASAEPKTGCSGDIVLWYPVPHVAQGHCHEKLLSMSLISDWYLSLFRQCYNFMFTTKTNIWKMNHACLGVVPNARALTSRDG